MFLLSLSNLTSLAYFQGLSSFLSRGILTCRFLSLECSPTFILCLRSLLKWKNCIIVLIPLLKKVFLGLPAWVKSIYPLQALTVALLFELMSLFQFYICCCDSLLAWSSMLPHQVLYYLVCLCSDCTLHVSHHACIRVGTSTYLYREVHILNK